MKRTLFVALAVAVMVMGVVAYATAAGQLIAVTAQVNPKLEITVADGDETASLVGLPGDGVVTDTSSINVRSNVAYDIQRTSTGEITGSSLPFTATGAVGANYPKAAAAAGANHTETFSLDLGDGSTDWLDPANLTETFTYSVVQH